MTRWQMRKRPPETHSEKRGDSITPWEGEVMIQQLEDSGVMWCPDCRQGMMHEGPSGGASVMVICGMCDSQFTIFSVSLPRTRVWGERVTDRKNDFVATT